MPRKKTTGRPGPELGFELNHNPQIHARLQELCGTTRPSGLGF
jgi:hypothetical protein